MDVILTKNSTVSEVNSGLCAKYKMHQEEKKMLFGSMSVIKSEITAYD